MATVAEGRLSHLCKQGHEQGIVRILPTVVDKDDKDDSLL